MESQITIEDRYCGPVGSANGGYTCGLMANFIEGTVEVTLKHPPPLNTPMTVRHEKDRLALYCGEILIAQATRSDLDMIPPYPPSLSAADLSTLKWEDPSKHYFPDCFVCGPKREVGDGLRIFPGPVTGDNYVATTWRPDHSLSDETGFVKNEIIWAALDCPSGFALFNEKMRFIILGKLAVQILKKVRPEEKCIVMGWPLEENGRKLYAGTAIFSAYGQLYAKGKATWIEFK